LKISTRTFKGRETAYNIKAKNASGYNTYHKAGGAKRESKKSQKEALSAKKGIKGGGKGDERLGGEGEGKKSTGKQTTGD